MRARIAASGAAFSHGKDNLMTEDWGKISADLERLLKLRSLVFGMKLFEKRDEMEAIPRIRRPQNVHTLDQIVGQAARLGWTIGVTADNLVGAQCRAVVGLGNAKESACADSWGRALKTRTPSLSIPCFAERRYGGVLDDEMLMALPPDYLQKAIAGMEALSKNGFRYPFPQYGIQ